MSPELNYALKVDYTLKTKMVIFEVEMKILIFVAWNKRRFLSCMLEEWRRKLESWVENEFLAGSIEDEVDDNRIISMEIISVMSRCPWPNDTYHFQVTEHYQNYWHQVQPYQHSKYQGVYKQSYFPFLIRSNFETSFLSSWSQRANLTLSSSCGVRKLFLKGSSCQ